MGIDTERKVIRHSGEIYSLEKTAVKLYERIGALEDQMQKLATAFNESTKSIEALAEELEAMKRNRQP